MKRVSCLAGLFLAGCALRLLLDFVHSLRVDDWSECGETVHECGFSILVCDYKDSRLRLIDLGLRDRDRTITTQCHYRVQCTTRPGACPVRDGNALRFRRFP